MGSPSWPSNLLHVTLAPTRETGFALTWASVHPSAKWVRALEFQEMGLPPVLRTFTPRRCRSSGFHTL